MGSALKMSLCCSSLTVRHWPSAVTSSTSTASLWKSPCLWLVLSMPPPMRSPPTVRESSSGTTARVTPRDTSSRLRKPMVTPGSTVTSRPSWSILRTSCRWPRSTLYILSL